MATVPRARGGSSLRSYGYGVALIAGSVAIFATTLRSGFMGDDFESTLSVIDPGPSLRWLTSVGAGGHIRPVLWVSVWLNHAAFGLTPIGWHGVNVVIHALTAWLVAVLAAALVDQSDLAGGTSRAAATTSGVVRHIAPPLAGVVFLVSPVHAEPVSWIAARADLLLAPLCIFSLLAWMRWRQRGGSWIWLSLVTFGLALGAKETAVALPLILLAYEVWLPRPGTPRWASVRRSLPPLVPFLVALVVYLVHRSNADPGFVEGEEAGWSSSGAIAVRSGLQTLVRSVLPSMPRSAWVLVAMVAAGASIVFLVAWLRARRRHEGLPFGPTFGFLLTSMVLSVVPAARLGTSLTTPGGGRFAYLSSVFGAVAIAVVLALLVDRAPRLGRVAIAAVVVGSLVALIIANQPYARAGTLAATLTDDQATWPRNGPITVLVAPDTLDGAWVGRNRSPWDLMLVHGWTGRSGYTEVSSFAMGGPDDTVTVTQGPCRWCVRVQLDHPDARFALPDASEVPTPTSAPLPHVLAMDDRTIDIELDPSTDPDTIWYFSGGHFVRLDLPLGR